MTNVVQRLRFHEPAQDLTWTRRFSAAPVTKLLRCHAAVLAEKAREVRGIGKSQIFGNMMDRLRAKYQLTLGFRQHMLADEVPGATPVARSTWSFSRSGHREFPSIEAN